MPPFRAKRQAERCRKRFFLHCQGDKPGLAIVEPSPQFCALTDDQFRECSVTSLAMIEAAAQRIDGRARCTPLLSSPFLDEIAGRRVFVKAECLQHTGSFKFRGGWSAVSGLDDAVRQRGVIAFSSGNHAQGVALAAKLFGVPCVIVMPSDAPKLKIDNTRAYGAEVVLYDRAHDDRDAIGATLSAERGLTLIKPFDEPLVIAGQGTVGLEIAEQAAEEGIVSGAVLVPCGGGGLTSGVALALEAKAPVLWSTRASRKSLTIRRVRLRRAKSVAMRGSPGRCVMRSLRRSRVTLRFPFSSGCVVRALR